MSEPEPETRTISEAEYKALTGATHILRGWIQIHDRLQDENPSLSMQLSSRIVMIKHMSEDVIGKLPQPDNVIEFKP